MPIILASTEEIDLWMTVPWNEAAALHADRRRTAQMMTEDAVLGALDKPRKLFSILQKIDPSGSQEVLQILLMKMRDQGKLKFDIKKGTWHRV